MSEQFYEEIDNISNKEPSELIKAMEDPNNILKYYGFLMKQEKITVQLKTSKGKYIPYDINTKDPLILLRFYHQARNSKSTKSGNWDKMELYLIEKNGNVIKKVEPTATIASLISDMSLAEDGPLPQLYFSYNPERVVQAVTKIQAQVRGRQIRKVEEPNGDCEGTNPKCSGVGKRINNKKMSNKARKSICNSYTNCDWKEVKKGGNKRKRKKKKKAFPSRKKNNRKNRTKKKTLSK